VELLSELVTALDDLARHRAVSVVVIKGAGNVFCAGHDISQLVGGNVTDYEAMFGTCVAVMEKIQQLPQPVIAQAHGVATAAGCQLVAACDLAVADEETRFGTPGVRIGLFCTTPAVPLVRAVGRKRALEMLLTGEMITARQAEAYGLINRVVAKDRLETETKAWALKIAEASPLTLSMGKAAFYNQVNLSDGQAYRHAKDAIVTNLFAEDAQEGLSAFLEKRKPIWKGK
jgi:enoyl-CoA hydratase/carnithine racemase